MDIILASFGQAHAIPFHSYNTAKQHFPAPNEPGAFPVYADRPGAGGVDPVQFTPILAPAKPDRMCATWIC
ncbi:MAG: hypothetical protein AB1647_12270, partial [Pseudomonadota bacterium]